MKKREQKPENKEIPNPEIEGALFLAEMDQHLPSVDLHGKFVDDVEPALEDLFGKSTTHTVRVVYGHGKGVLRNTVHAYLTKLKREGKIKAFKEESHYASCVVVID